MISPLSVIWLPWLQLLLLAALCLSFAANPRQLEGVVADFATQLQGALHIPGALLVDVLADDEKRAFAAVFKQLEKNL